MRPEIPKQRNKRCRGIRVVGKVTPVHSFSSDRMSLSRAACTPLSPLLRITIRDKIQRRFCGPPSIPLRRKGKVLNIVLIRALLLALLAPLRALAWSENPATPEGWAWKQIKAGNLAEFNHCGTALDPHKADGWDDPCRQVPAQFLVDILTIPKWQNQVTRVGVRLHGAHIVGDIDLSNASFRGLAIRELSRRRSKSQRRTFEAAFITYRICPRRSIVCRSDQR